MNDRTKRAERREPSFGTGRGESRDDFDMRLSDDDRPSRGHRAPPRHEARQPPRRDKRSGGGGGRRRGRRGRSFLGGLFYWTLVLGLWCAIGLGGLVAYHAAQLPPINQLTVPKRPPNIAILAADGSLLANRGETGGRTITIGEVPPYLPKAFVAIEDRRFYDHFGIDPIGLGRALVNNLRRAGGVQGGSTLTQQLAKNLFLTQERTAARKIQEAILALWLERTYSKDQILELYLNRVYFGSGAYGVEAAAQRYFNKSARSVTIAEAAMLAGLVQAPSRLAPNRNPEAAEKRAQLVIAAMADQGYITAERRPRPPLVATRRKRAERIPGGLGQLCRRLCHGRARRLHRRGRGRCHRRNHHDRHQGAVLGRDDPGRGAVTRRAPSYGVGQGAVVSMASDGGIRALIGGRDYTKSQFNRATAAAASRARPSSPSSISRPWKRA
jgi:penicillin-binding protein 1A